MQESTLIKYTIMYHGQREPDYETSFFYEFIDKSFKRISFKELYTELGDNCVKYIELEGGNSSADFYIKDTFNINLLIDKYDYLDIKLN